MPMTWFYSESLSWEERKQTEYQHRGWNIYGLVEGNKLPARIRNDEVGKELSILADNRSLKKLQMNLQNNLTIYCQILKCRNKLGYTKA